MQAQAIGSVQTFTIGFEEADFDESHHARAVAKHLGTEHHELFVTAKQAYEVIPKLSAMYDEPFADSSAFNFYLLSKFTRKHVKVALSEDGADELFKGYNKHRALELVKSSFFKAE